MTKPWEQDWGVDAMTSAAPVAKMPWEMEWDQGSVSSASPLPENQLLIKTHLLDKGYNKNAIAGIMANIDVETGGSFDFKQQQIGGPGYGLFQLDPTGPLPNAYEDWLTSNEKEDSAVSQLDFMHETVYGEKQDIIGRGNARKIRNIFEDGDATSAARIFMDVWERPGVPHWERREESAKRFQETFENM